jgi:predicted RNA-binding Zn-ribbon protein involved in translation (DUF1610 family)
MNNWKPKAHFSSVNSGACPNCGHNIPLSDFIESDLIIKTEHEPVDMSEPNYHCDNCGTDIVVDLALQFVVNTTVFPKIVLDI